MEMESFGKMLPAILFPYMQQWAERSGFTLLTQLLVDEQFRALFEKYGDQMVRGMARGSGTPGNGNGHGKRTESASPLGKGDQKAGDFTDLQDRVLAMETQQEAQQALLAPRCGHSPSPLAAVPNAWSAWTSARSAGARARWRTIHPIIRRSKRRL